MSNIYRETWVSPVGELHLYADSDHLLALAFDANDRALQKKLGLEEATPGEVSPIRRTVEQLREYFAGERKEFDLPLRMRGTDFQLKAWTALRGIPYGTCVSYSSQAASMDKAAAIRAVGAANGQNPYSIVVPCHRVIGKNGKLTGYAGGEDVKEALLRLEGYLK